MPRKWAKAEPSGFSILLVDDQEETTISSKLLLEREGHRIVTAVSGAEALALFAQDKFDLVVVDYFMPRMSGEELVHEIRKFDSYVQIILQTGYSGEKPPREMLQLLDIQGYHDKSEGPERFLIWVDVALKAADHLRELYRSDKELSESRTQLRNLSARLLTAQDEERERISRELHDQLGQLLTAIGLDIDWAMQHLPEEPESLGARLTEAHKLVTEAIEETRALCATLRPGHLRGTRLIEEIKSHATEFAARTGLKLELRFDAERIDFSEPSSRNIYRIAQEALSNIARHAHASSVSFDIAARDDVFVMTIADNGIGFDPEAISDSHAVGLIGMRERALLIGARLDIQSSPASGTTVRLEVPQAGSSTVHAT